MRLKYKLFREDADIECFHATEDSQRTRNQVFDAIKRNKDISMHLAYVDKRLLDDRVKDKSGLYAHMGGSLIESCLNSKMSQKINKIIVIIDKALHKKERGRFKFLLKPKLQSINDKYRIYFHQITSDFNAQMADYGAWSLYVKLDRNELRPIQALKPINPIILHLS